AIDPIIIDIPRGGYVPVFRVREAEISQPPPSLPGPSVKSPRQGLILAFLTGVVLTASIATIVSPKVVRPFRVTAATGAEFPELWGPFLQRGANDIIAYGVPLFFASEGLYIRDVDVNILEQQDRRRVDSVAKALHISPRPQDDIYTGVGEIEATYRISNFFATNGIRVQVTSARALGRSDLTGHNVVVISSLRFQTLLRDLKLPTDFEFVPSWPEVIRNLHPKPGESAQYAYERGAGISTSYALVSVWPGITPGTRIMSISGIHTWSTQSAADFL